MFPAAYMEQNVIRQIASPAAGRGREISNEPSTLPLNPGEGGALPPYGDGPWPDTGSDMAGEPSTLPLNPGEGGALPPYGDGPWTTPDSGGGTPLITWPDTPNRPTRPNRPNRPSTGSGTSSGTNWWGSCGSNNCGVTILPGVIGGVWPSSSKVRFLNAGYNHPSFRIFIGNRQVVNLLNYASATNYEQVNAGYQTVTVSGANGYVYIQKAMPFQANAITTIAIINTSSGLDLLQIADSCCPPTNGYASLRVGNLAYNTTPLDVILSDGRVVWTDLRYKEVTSFKRIMPGTYQFLYADTNMMPMPTGADIETLDSAWLGVYPPQETVGSMYLDVTRNTIYTVYLLQSGTGQNNIQNLILMDR